MIIAIFILTICFLLIAIATHYIKNKINEVDLWLHANQTTDAVMYPSQMPAKDRIKVLLNTTKHFCESYPNVSYYVTAIDKRDISFIGFDKPVPTNNIVFNLIFIHKVKKKMMSRVPYYIK